MKTLAAAAVVYVGEPSIDLGRETASTIAELKITHNQRESDDLSQTQQTWSLAMQLGSASAFLAPYADETQTMPCMHGPKHDM